MHSAIFHGSENRYSKQPKARYQSPSAQGPVDPETLLCLITLYMFVCTYNMCVCVCVVKLFIYIHMLCVLYIICT